jgi:hypothetical protein
MHFRIAPLPPPSYGPLLAAWVTANHAVAPLFANELSIDEPIVAQQQELFRGLNRHSMQCGRALHPTLLTINSIICITRSG